MKKTLIYALTLFTAISLSCGGDDGPGPVIPPVDDEVDVPAGTIPYFVISTGDAEVVDEPKVPGSMKIYIDQQEVFSNPLGIELRGSTSRLLFPKKSYGMETWNASGEDFQTAILDFPVEEDWILHGPYADKTLVRNALIYDLSNRMGFYAVRTQLAELNLNGNYKGVYFFMEKIKRDRNRVNVLSLEPNQTDNSVISGGYILKIDKTAGDTEDSNFSGDFVYTEDLGFRSNYGTQGNVLGYEPYGNKRGEETYFLYEYPDPSRINQQQKDYIENYIREFEDALVNENFSGPRAYEDYIDVASFVDFFILNELSANPDAYRLSTFMNKDRNGKLKMGPIWDFNLAFGNEARSQVEGWIYRYNENNPGDLWLVHFWWTKLMQDPQFRAAIKTRWNEVRGGALANTIITTRIDAWVAEMEANGALERNFNRWPIIGQPVPFNDLVGQTYEQDVMLLKNWINARISWMDSQIQSW